MEKNLCLHPLHSNLDANGQLQQGLEALQMNPPECQRRQLLDFAELICKWNKVYNLTGAKTTQELLQLHILDSLSALPHCQGAIMDLGSGAGLPGIPLATLLPNCHFTLLDANGKKTRFIQQAVLELRLKNVTVLHSRAEAITGKTFATVIMRAVANVATCVGLGLDFIDNNGVLLLMKAHTPHRELAEMQLPFSVIPVRLPNVAAARCLIKIKRRQNG